MHKLPNKPVLAIALLPALSGCVAAAAAIPIIAGGTMATSGGIDTAPEPQRGEVTVLPPPPAAEVTPADSEVELADSSVETAPGARMPIDLSDPPEFAPATTSGDASAPAQAAPPAGETVTLANVEPAPAETAPVASAEPAPGLGTQTADTSLVSSPPIAEPAGSASLLDTQQDPELAAAPVEPAHAELAPSGTATTSAGLPPVRVPLPDGRTLEISNGGAEPATGTGIAAAPARPNIAAGAGVGPLDTRLYDPLVSYTTSHAAPTLTGERQRVSALLVEPGALQPETIECGMSPPAVVIDLDPAGEVLDTMRPAAPNPELGEVLGQLRAQDIAIYWISGNVAAEAGSIRRRLAEAGLDPAGRDELVLMRYDDDRKQIRRRSIGSTHCVVAIAGDARRDFDELYAYLRDQSDAAALEPLIGRGWFLIPQPLASE